MIAIDKPRFEMIFRGIFKAYVARTGVFAQLRAENFGPQNLHTPTGVAAGTPDHLYWLTLVALSDRRTNSKWLYPRFARMFSRNARLFVRGVYPSLGRMTELFRRYRIAVPVSDIAFFIERKRHLDELFAGDPVSIFTGVRDIDELMLKFRRIARAHRITLLFPGAKQKMFSLLAMYLSEFTELEFADVVPIDVWVQSIATSTEVLVGEGKIAFNPLEKALRPLMTEVYQDFRHIRGVSNATWIHGKVLCTNCSRVDTSSECAVYAECKGPFRRMRHPITGEHSGYIEIPPDFVPKASTS